MVSRSKEEQNDEGVELGVIGDQRLKEKNLVFAVKELSVRERRLFSTRETSSAKVQSGGIWKRSEAPCSGLQLKIGYSLLYQG